MNAMPYEQVSCPCDYRIQNLVRVNSPKIEEQEPKIGKQEPKIGEQEPKIEEQKMNERLTEFYKQAFGHLPAPIGEPELEKFAALVAAAEREAICQVADDMLRGVDAIPLIETIRERGQE
jgi:hypothetical protein